MSSRNQSVKLLDNFFKRRKYSDSDAKTPEAARIANGVLKNLTFIDYMIESTIQKDIKSVQKALLNILRCAVFEVVFDETPDYAVVNSYVEIAKKVSKRSSGYVNAVLKKFASTRSEIALPDKEQNALKYLSVKYSHPIWLLQRWLNFYGFEKTAQICEFNNSVAGLNIRVNTLKISVEEFIKKLEENGVDFEQNEYLEECLKIRHHGDISDIFGYSEGFFTVQGVASCLPAKVLAPKTNQKVLDVCASPGGKTMHMAALMGNMGEITAIDVSDAKLEKITENLQRLSISNVELVCADAAKFSTKEKYDCILVDAPCSNTGILSKKADIRWVRKEKDIKSLTKIQYDILNNVAKFLKKGSVLVYSTCSIEPEENLEVVNKFLYNNSDFRLSPFILGEENNGFVQILPSYLGMEGFFIAKFVRS